MNTDEYVRNAIPRSSATAKSTSEAPPSTEAHGDGGVEWGCLGHALAAPTS